MSSTPMVETAARAACIGRTAAGPWKARLEAATAASLRKGGMPRIGGQIAVLGGWMARYAGVSPATALAHMVILGELGDAATFPIFITVPREPR